MLNTIIAALRLIAILFVTLISLFIVLLLFPLIPKKHHPKIIKYWAHITLWCVGAKFDIETLDDESAAFILPNSMVIANHVSWLDIPVLYALYAVSFVAKAEIKAWPILGMMATRVGTIFINRSQKRNLGYINHSISDHLINGKMVVVFPEGTTTDGATVIPFKSSLFESAIASGAKIIPITIKYYKKNGDFADSVSYSGNLNLWQSVTNSLKLNGIQVKVIKLSPVTPSEFTNRNQLSKHLYDKIYHTYTNHI